MEKVFFTKKEVAARYAVTDRTLDNWRKRYGILAPSMIAGTSPRWSVAQVMLMDRVLAGDLNDAAAVVELGIRQAAGVATRGPGVQRRPGKMTA